MITQTAIPSNNMVQKPSLARRIWKWTWRTILVVALLIGGLIGALYLTAMRPTQPVGFQVQKAKDSAGKPFAIGIWYPTSSEATSQWANSFFMSVAKNGDVKGSKLPLVVLSHGTGGGITSHTDLALALASAGYVVAAPMHSDNYIDSSAVGTPKYFTGRNSELNSTIDFIVKDWTSKDAVDSNRVGAFGFSIGGFTVLTSIGAKPDLRGVSDYCANNKEFVCDMLAASNSFILGKDLPSDVDQFQYDPRIKAAVLAAPGFGFTMTSPTALENITIPIQIWQGDKDTFVPYETNSKLINQHLKNKADLHLVANAAHVSFLAPCGILAFTPICDDPVNFQREKFHDEMNSIVLEFFEKNLL